MPTSKRDEPMPLLDSRDAYMDHLESESAGAEPTGARLRKNLVKSYVIETRSPSPRGTQRGGDVRCRGQPPCTAPGRR